MRCGDVPQALGASDAEREDSCMFDFLRRSAEPVPVTPGVAEALVSSGLPAGTDSAALRMLQKRGAYSGRPVRYFRVFDPARAAEQEVSPRTFADLDTHPDLVLGSGHLERNGAVMLNRRTRA
jgi:hypothetical protein